MRIIPVPVGKGKNKDILEVTIFGDFVRAACINFHINDIVERNLPKDFRDPKGLNYLNDYAIKAIIESHHQNSRIFPNEQLAGFEYLETIRISSYIAGLATQNRDVIETMLTNQDDEDFEQCVYGLTLNPIITESDLIRILKGKKVVVGLKIDVINHPNFTQEVAKLFANEENDDVIEHLKARKDIIIVMLNFTFRSMAVKQLEILLSLINNK
jgi:hypothetical protein|nr:MAG TPA: hypothetical protein [Ackermannviridae sp.]